MDLGLHGFQTNPGKHINFMSTIVYIDIYTYIDMYIYIYARETAFFNHMIFMLIIG